jgi:polyisoprenoid-binding protein YceI
MPTSSLTSGAWRLDPSDSTVEFRVRHFYGLMTVKGHFDHYAGTVDLQARPAVQLTIQADSLETKHKKRDEHLRSKDFFDIEQHPEVRFVSDTATLHGDTLKVSGKLHAAGKTVPLELEARITKVGGQPHIEATTTADHRDLGMTWSPLGIMRAPSTLIVRGRLIPA